MGQTIQQRQLKVLEQADAANRRVEADIRKRVKVGDVAKFNAGRWGSPKAATIIVVRTYKAPDDDTILGLPSSSEYYAPTLEAIASGTLDSMKDKLPGIYAQCRTFHVSEFRL